MAKFTIEIHSLLERGYNLPLDQYPIFDEEYRPFLNQKIIEHFYYREIGQETPDRFSFFLARKMNEIMPYYNQLYQSELLQFDPLITEYHRQTIETENEMRKKSGTGTKSAFENETGNVLTRNTDTRGDENYKEDGNETHGNEYQKSGLHDIKDDKERTEDLSQTSTQHGTTENDLETNTTEHGVRTDDLTEKTDETRDRTGKINTRGNTSTVFSDIPQAGIETTTVQAPDGTITTTTQGYATTKTDVSETGTEDRTEHETIDGTRKNTGTVTEDGTRNQKDTGTVTRDEKGTTTHDNTINETQDEHKTWSEKGSDSGSSEKGITGSRGSTGNTKEDSQQNINETGKLRSFVDEKTNQNQSMWSVILQSGRRSVSPSKLLNEFRSTMLNIDMMIIDELEELFMGVY